ncbi:MAG: anthranilate synthase component I family protein [Sarcina sp.]
MVREICSHRDKFYYIFDRMDKRGRVLFRVKNNENDLTYIAENPKFYLTLEDGCILKKNKYFEVIEQLEGNDVLGYIESYIKPKGENKFPFMGGFIGCLGYDLVSQYEKTLDFQNYDDIKCPDLILGYYDEFFVYDENKEKGYLVSDDESINYTYSGLKKYISSPYKKETTERKIESNYSKDEFCNLVMEAKKRIEIGDIFQVVLSQRVTCTTEKSSFEIYNSLENINLSPYMYCFDFQEFSVVGASPEVLVSAKDNICKTNPIAGTIKRGEVDDMSLIEKLKSDEKECVEHLMLVDLGRNDVGKVCEFNSVKVSEFMKGEIFSHVIHLCSTVEGVMKSDVQRIEVIKAMMPVGTVSGAPKVKAMEIIESLENRKRGLYSGGIGYIAANGNIDMAIAIRTLIMKNNKVYLQAGAGVVYDSVPENEYFETLNKMKVLMEVI